MKIDTTTSVSWPSNHCAVFFRTRERFGSLSNMAAGFPLRVGSYSAFTSEALYQACRYPHLPEFQWTILRERNPMKAKMISRTRVQETRPDWFDIRVGVMDWVLNVKLSQHKERFGAALEETGLLPIVEKSNKDAFWGAKPQEDGSLVGINVLGQLLSALRSNHRLEHTVDASNDVTFLVAVR